MARKLPVRLHLKHGAYYYVHQNKWTRLSADYTESLKMYADLMRPNKGGMEKAIDDWLLDVIATVKPATMKNYRFGARRLKKHLSDFSPHDLRPKHVAQLMFHYRTQPGIANLLRNVLKLVISRLVVAGEMDANPVSEVKALKENQRERYLTHAEYHAIYEAASPTMKAIMDVAYQTGQRISDVLKMRLSDIGEDTVFVRQKKTGKKERIALTPDLRDAINQAKALRRKVRGLTLFCTNEGGQVSYWTVRTLWKRAIEAAGVQDATLHDLRAKAGTDAKALGLDSKALLGHTSESSHRRYLRAKEEPVVQPPPRPPKIRQGQ